MTRPAEPATKDPTVAQLKRVILARKHDSLETLEDAVDAFLWSERDRQQLEQGPSEESAAPPLRPR